ncbi:MATE family efflux transporter [Photorhabdus akhurstii]|uniref:MATE family efflux transporter n=1 Tax=Photorhabdus akhurstii TaxID=171438 RepID=UPI002F954F0D
MSFYNVHEIAGFSIAFRIQSFVILPAIALGTAMAIHYNNSLSKQNFVRSNQVFLIGLSLTGVIYIFISAAVFFLKVWLVKIFTLDELITEAALRYLNCLSPSYFSLGIVLGLTTALEQIGQGLRVLLINITLYSLEIGIAALLGLKQEDATRLYLTIAIFNWISVLYTFSIFNKKSDCNIKYSYGDIHS